MRRMSAPGRMSMQHYEFRVSSLPLLAAFLLAGGVMMVFAPDADARHRHHHSRGGGYSPPSSSLIIDGYTGKVLHSSAASEARRPASLTKVMTLYLAFEAIRAGRLKMDTELTVSAHAAAQDPTKLDLDEGDKITVRDAIRGLVTKSANDAAVVLAERLGGSEDAFAKLMTAKARQLGMQNTTFRNASGLPNSEQITTARDLSILAQRVLNDFPVESAVFQTRYFNYKGNIYRNHNSLLFNYVGAEGMKTGFTQASGFNLIATARRNGKFLIGVVLGGRSARSRDENMRSLLNSSWVRAGAKPAKAPEVIAIAEIAPPKPAPAPVVKPAAAPEKAPAKPVPAAEIKPAPAPAKAAGKPVPADKQGQVMLASTAPAAAAAKPAPPVHTAPPAQDVPAGASHSRQRQDIQAIPVSATVEYVPAVKGPSLLTAAISPAAAAEPPAIAPAAEIKPVEQQPAAAAAPVIMSGKRFLVQVGAYSTEESARQRLAAVMKDAGDLLTG
jgi:D-alanyl-D-alanine carboxypeptidase